MIKNHSLIKNATKNSIGLIGSQIISKSLGFIAFIYLARYLGESDFGIFNFVFSFWAIVVTIIESGLGSYATRAIAEDTKNINKYLSGLFLIKFLYSVIVYTAIVILIESNIISDNSYKNTTLLIYGIGIFINQGGWYSLISCLRGVQKFKIEMASNVFNSILNASLIFIAIILNLTLLEYIIGLNILSVLLFAFTFYLFNRESKFKYVYDKLFFQNMVTKSLPFAFTYIISDSNFRLGIVILSFLAGDIAVGIFSASSRIIYQGMFIVSASLITVYPILSNLYLEDKKSVSSYSQVILKYLIFISLPVILFIVTFAGSIIDMLYGNKFIGAEKVLSIMIVWFFVWAIKSLTVTILQATHLERKLSLQSFYGMITNIVFSVILINKFGISGLAMAAVISEFIMLVYGVYVLNVFKILNNIWKTLLPTIILGVFYILIMYNPIIKPNRYFILGTLILVNILHCWLFVKDNITPLKSFLISNTNSCSE